MLSAGALRMCDETLRLLSEIEIMALHCQMGPSSYVNQFRFSLTTGAHKMRVRFRWLNWEASCNGDLSGGALMSQSNRRIFWGSPAIYELFAHTTGSSGSRCRNGSSFAEGYQSQYGVFGPNHGVQSDRDTLHFVEGPPEYAPATCGGNHVMPYNANKPPEAAFATISARGC